MTERETYVENMKLELDKLNDQLSALEEKAANARRDARDKYEIELIKLRSRSRDARSKWEQLQAASEASWHQWVSDMDHLRDAFIHACHDFKARL